MIFTEDSNLEPVLNQRPLAYLHTWFLRRNLVWLEHGAARCSDLLHAYLQQRAGAATRPGPASRNTPQIVEFTAGLCSFGSVTEFGLFVDLWAYLTDAGRGEARRRGRIQPTSRPSCLEALGILGVATAIQHPAREFLDVVPGRGFTLVM